jgi:hypothetical protein
LKWNGPFPSSRWWEPMMAVSLAMLISQRLPPRGSCGL